MAINEFRVKSYDLIEKIPDEKMEFVFNVLYNFRHALEDSKRPTWSEIEAMSPDDVELSEEEKRQIENSHEFVTWEDAMNELNLPTQTES